MCVSSVILLLFIQKLCKNQVRLKFILDDQRFLFKSKINNAWSACDGSSAKARAPLWVCLRLTAQPSSSGRSLASISSSPQCFGTSSKCSAAPLGLSLANSSGRLLGSVTGKNINTSSLQNVLLTNTRFNYYWFCFLMA